MIAPTSRRPRLPPALAIAALALAGLVALTIVLAAVGAFEQRTATTTVIQPTAAGPAPRLNAPAIYAGANPGVVDITDQTTTTTTNPFGQRQTAAATQSGTGLVLDRKGDILTADHVVDGTHSITVKFQDGATRPATVLGGDTATDVAVLHVDPSGLTLHPLPLGTLAGLRVGDPLAVIGDPFNVQRSLSTGLVSGLDRTIQAPNGFSIPNAVQTDAAIDPGNSGGPVLDARGHVVGIADQIATGGSGADQSSGVGFAVSIDVIKPELASLEAGKVPAHANLGVSANDATDSQGRTGAIVQSVQAGGAAAHAGIRTGDLIVRIGSTKITGVGAVVAAIAKHHPGDRVPVTVVRDGRQRTVQATFTKQPTRAVAG